MNATSKSKSIDGIRSVISGRFQEQLEAEQAVSALKKAGFAPGQIASFYVSTPGQHAIYPIGGDEEQSPGTEGSVRESVETAGIGTVAGVVTGLAALPVLGPVAVAAGAGVGAWVGSLYGALNGAEEQATPGNEASQARDAVRKSGMLVAIAVDSATHEQRVIEIMRNEAALEIALGKGRIEGGDWNDFDPLEPLHQV
jgi:hypothetical protein